MTIAFQNRTEKVRSLEKCIEMTKSVLIEKPFLAIGGMTNHNCPMALVRALSCQREQVNGITVSGGPMMSLPMDYLAAAGMLKKCVAAYVSFEQLGLAPNFRTAVQNGEVEVWECDETMIVAGFEAAAKGLPCGITRAGIGTDLLQVNAELKEFADPISGEKVIAVPPLKPAVAFLHVQKADAFGNCINEGPIFLDRLIAQATKRSGGIVIASTEEIQDHAATIADPWKVTFPSILIDAVVEIPWGAHPCSSNGRYRCDDESLEDR